MRRRRRLAGGRLPDPPSIGLADPPGTRQQYIARCAAHPRPRQYRLDRSRKGRRGFLRSAAGCSWTHQSGPAAKPAPGRSGRPLGSGATVLCPALGEMLPARDFDVLRCIEGAPMKETYKLVTGRIGISRSRCREASSSADAAFIHPITRSLLAAMHCSQVCEVPDCRHSLAQMRDSQVFLHNCAVDSRCARSRSLAQMHQGGS